ncbi:hypothetical protein PCC79_01820 [Propioniciclava soli]|uniref:O-antigen ligase domain-containing protein n=1 Tax=Propioniciclava soli TaxID=2775081 RepID=A0ABZ3CB34_9ACTN
MAAFLPLAGPVSSAAAVPLLLSPLWLRRARRTAVGWLATLACLAVGGGLITAEFMSTGARISSTSLAVSQSLMVLSIVLGAGTVVWASHLLNRGWVAVTFGVGMLIGQARLGLSSDNPWKYDLFIPVTLILLGTAWARGARRPEMVALLGIALLSIINDSRSAASIAAVGLVALVWQWAQAHLKVRTGRFRILVTLGFLGMTMYLLIQTFILEGYLGAATQARSQAQMRAAGSLILGGRPELGATRALLEASPWGYGLGIIPDSHDVWIAKTGMSSLNYEPDNGYVEKYMFGGGMEVHSVLGDLWLRCGPLGAALGLALVAVIVSRLATRLAEGEAPALLVILTLLVCWDALFSPLYVTAVQVLAVTLGLSVEGPQFGNKPENQLRPLSLP